MMKIIKLYIMVITFAISLAGCEKFLYDDDPINTPTSNFDYLWEQADQKYSFFEFKNIDWNEVYYKYRPLINDKSSDEELFDVMSSMLFELRDAHVNLFAPFNISRYHKVFLNSPPNFDYNIIERNYLGEDYYITGSLLNQILVKDEKRIGYIYYGSFVGGVSESNLDFLVKRFRDVDGIIIDVRDNGGGDPTYAFRIAERFAYSTTHVYNTYLKNGPAHDDFTLMNKVSLEASDNSFDKPVILLTNRGSYSATNMFTAMMKAIYKCTVVGDTTGGGGGAPVGGELPNGWTYRFSGTKTIMPDGFNIENGIPPDVTIWMNPDDLAKGEDTILDSALTMF